MRCLDSCAVGFTLCSQQGRQVSSAACARWKSAIVSDLILQACEVVLAKGVVSDVTTECMAFFERADTRCSGAHGPGGSDSGCGCSLQCRHLSQQGQLGHRGVQGLSRQSDRSQVILIPPSEAVFGPTLFLSQVFAVPLAVCFPCFRCLILSTITIHGHRKTVSSDPAAIA